MGSPALTVSRILHAGYVLEHEGARIAFDPIFENPFSTNATAFPDVRFDLEQVRAQRFDAIFISHFHDDHCSFDSLALLDRKTPLHVYCRHPVLFEWLRELGFTDVHPLRLDAPVAVGGFEVCARRALDADVDSLLHVRAGGLELLNVVDSVIDDDTLAALAQDAPFDLVLWPFQTMRELEVLSPARVPAAPAALPPEWLAQLGALRPRFVVPSSCQLRMEAWSWYNRAFFPVSYQRFREELEAALPETRVVRLDPGVSVTLDARALTPAPRLAWVEPLGPQNVDYDFAPDAAPPPTSEVARRFPALDEAERARVFDYCRAGLLERYRALDPPDGDFFRKARRWRLTTYDHEGTGAHFWYRLRNEDIEPAPCDGGDAAWTTEVPAFKLHAALAHGEQLTSMYVRINDGAFPPEVARAQAEVEVVDDPLLRCLFSGVFGAYQAAQLARWSRRQGAS